MKITHRAARIGLALFVLLSLSTTYSHGQQQRPNVLLILADDMGVNDLGHVNQNKTRTPNIDQLARQGISFSRHYSDSSCSPSRAALLTGMNPARIGFHPAGLTLPEDIVTLPEFLRRQGYHTALFGKWHVGDLLVGDGPDKHGFDEWFGMLSHFYLAGATQDGRILGRKPVYIDPWLQRDGAAPVQHKGHIDDLLTAEVVAAIAKKSDQPWFIYVPFLAPHTPSTPSKEFADKYPNTAEGRYRALIEQLDTNIGIILKQLNSSGLAENTIVIFASDNGGTGDAFPSNSPFVGAKATYGEGGIRTPLIVHWPKHWYGGTRVDDVKYIADIYPTLANALGVKANTQLDGVDLFKRRDKPLFWYNHSIWSEAYSMLSADGEWRLLGDSKTSELLHYANGRTTPETRQNPAVQARLSQQYLKWRNSITLLPNSGQDGESKFVASPFRANMSVGFSFSLPGALAVPSESPRQGPSAAAGKPIALIANKQFDISYSAGEFILNLDSAVALRFPYPLPKPCNSIHLNFNIAQDNTPFYMREFTLVKLYINDSPPMVREFKIERMNSSNFAPLTMGDFNTQPRGPVASRSVAISSRLWTDAEIAQSSAALDRDYCGKPDHGDSIGAH
jgi:arylsulfatase A-like enzyme